LNTVDEKTSASGPCARPRAGFFACGRAHYATLAQRVSALEAKLACVTRAPVNEFPRYAKYGDELIGENATNVYDEADSGNPDSLTDLGSTVGLDWDIGATPSFGFWVLTIKRQLRVGGAVLVTALGDVDLPEGIARTMRV
jgi:hypothetical protein